MRCSDARAAISARIDGEPLGVSESELDSHLASCADCRSESERAAMAGAILRTSGSPAASPAFDDRVLAAVTRRCWFDRMCDWFEAPHRRLAAALAAPLAALILSHAIGTPSAMEADRSDCLHRMAIGAGIDPADAEVIYSIGGCHSESEVRGCV